MLQLANVNRKLSEYEEEYREVNAEQYHAPHDQPEKRRAELSDPRPDQKNRTSREHERRRRIREGAKDIPHSDGRASRRPEYKGSRQKNHRSRIVLSHTVKPWLSVQTDGRVAAPLA